MKDLLSLAAIAAAAAYLIWRQIGPSPSSIPSSRTTPPARPGRYEGEEIRFTIPQHSGFANPQYGWVWTRTPDTGAHFWAPAFGVQ